MPNPRSPILCITLTPNSAQIAEAKRAGGAAQVVRRSTLRLDERLSLDRPEALGVALREHLKANGYTARHAVVGLCPRWVLARHKLVPPADKDALRGIVNLQVEREFAGSAAEMAFDYLLGQDAGAGQRSLLLVGARRSVLDQVEQVVTTAGLKLDAVTPTALAAAHGRPGTVVLVEDGVAGITIGDGVTVAGLVSCTADPDRFANADARTRLITDLARTSLRLPADAGIAAGATTLLLPESVSEHDARALIEQLQQRFGPATAEQGEAAVLLAEHVFRQDTPCIDFTASRLAAPPRKRIPPAAAWAIRAAVLVLLVGGTFGYLWLDAKSQRDDLQAEYDSIKDRAEQAKAVRADLRQAEAWYDKRPPVLESLRELTHTFPTEGEIRVTSLLLDAEMQGKIDCKAGDKETMDNYFTQMQQSPRLKSVDGDGAIRSNTRNEQGLEFSISFLSEPNAQGGDDE